MIGQRITQARLAAGLSLRALGERVGLSQTAVDKYEKGELMPSSGTLAKLAQALGVRVEYFFRTEQVDLIDMQYRKHAHLSAGRLKQVHADVLDQLERQFALYHLLPTSIPPFELPAGLAERIETLEAIEDLAHTVRQAWKLGENPIPDLMDTLEAHGILVLLTSAHKAEKFDGLSVWANNVPVIVVGADWPGDRQRFTLAHELGHLLLKERLAGELDEEKAADRFAGALLVPASAAFQALGEHRTWLEPRELMLLKQEYGLSMGGWLCRAYQLGILNRQRFQMMQGFFRKRGWHRQEPGKPYPREQIRRFSRSVYHALAEDLINESKAAELLGESLMELHAERCMDVADATAH